MNSLKVLGQEKVGDFKFTGIEGGFGERKKSMLVKDIAEIHQSTVKRINELINRNKTRFREGVDVLDLKQVVSNDLFSEYGFTKAQWGNSNNIYLLSERGYSKLLKILEDDTAWEIYDQLVDNYFAMRQSIESENKALLADKRLEIMEQNAATRRAQLMYKIAMATKSQRHRELMLNRAGKELVGEMVIPAMEVESVEYTASEVAEKLGVLTKAGKPYPAKVGEYANRISLKAEQPGQNEYGRWIISKSKYSAKEVAQWVYFEAGVQKLKEYLELIK
ncbi:ORF6N domain-containing protein [Ligilactobacillus murinus]|uniref:ORF6N domain-containing protein n=1 Tax=Lactobacillaceae TaxID=33958 RepID=UPI001C8C42BD|nr:MULTISPECIES: ORF6N domain-containing protein [Lactobacillaceae]MBX9012621.1 ORF6N domain-containing protein [Ligilactobacillus murinus]